MVQFVPAFLHNLIVLMSSQSSIWGGVYNTPANVYVDMNQDMVVMTCRKNPPNYVCTVI